MGDADGEQVAVAVDRVAEERARVGTEQLVVGLGDVGGGTTRLLRGARAAGDLGGDHVAGGDAELGERPVPDAAGVGDEEQRVLRRGALGHAGVAARVGVDLDAVLLAVAEPDHEARDGGGARRGDHGGIHDVGLLDHEAARAVVELGVAQHVDLGGPGDVDAVLVVVVDRVAVAGAEAADRAGAVHLVAGYPDAVVAVCWRSRWPGS